MRIFLVLFFSCLMASNPSFAKVTCSVHSPLKFVEYLPGIAELPFGSNGNTNKILVRLEAAIVGQPHAFHCTPKPENDYWQFDMVIPFAKVISEDPVQKSAWVEMQIVEKSSLEDGDFDRPQIKETKIKFEILKKFDLYFYPCGPDTTYQGELIEKHFLLSCTVE